MRILALGNLYPPAAAGGYERIWASAMHAALDAGHEVRVLTTAPVAGRPVAPDADGGPGPPVFRELRWYWRDHEWWRPSLRERRALERHNQRVLERHLTELRPEVASVWGMGGLPLSLLERLGVPALGVVADAWMLYGPRVDPALRVRRPRWQTAARWLFISAALRDAVGIDGELLHPGVDPEAFPRALPQEWRWRLACIGRLEPGKGIETAIEALELLPEATLTLDGEGAPAHVADLRDLAADFGVSGRVRFQRSPSKRVHLAYAAADAVLFPVTWPEPWGLVPLEAMSVGRPVVATGAGGSAEYLRDGDNALLHPPGDARALAEAVGRLAQDDALRARLLGGGRTTAAHFTAAAFDAAVLRELGQITYSADESHRGAYAGP